MKIELVITRDNHIKGWNIIPEDKDEQLTLGSIRNALFFGLSSAGTFPKYAGCKSDDDNCVTELSFVIPKYKESD